MRRAGRQAFLASCVGEGAKTCAQQSLSNKIQNIFLLVLHNHKVHKHKRRNLVSPPPEQQHLHRKRAEVAVGRDGEPCEVKLVEEEEGEVGTSSCIACRCTATSHLKQH